MLSHHGEKIQEKIIERTQSEIGNDQTFYGGIMANLLKAYEKEEDNIVEWRPTISEERKFYLLNDVTKQIF